MEVKEIEEITWKVINAKTKEIHERDQHYRKIMSKLNVEVI